MSKFPKHFKKMLDRYPDVMDSLKAMSEATESAGPLDAKTAHLIKLGAAAAQKSEGAVHSQVRKAKKAGANKEEIRQAILLLVPTIGWPTTAAALSWADDELD